jgi:hypothetical protein
MLAINHRLRCSQGLPLERKLQDIEAVCKAMWRALSVQRRLALPRPSIVLMMHWYASRMKRIFFFWVVVWGRKCKNSHYSNIFFYQLKVDVFLTSALVEVQWSASRSGCFIMWERAPPPYPLVRRLLGPRVGVDKMEKLRFLTVSGFELCPFSHPASSQSLFRLC